MCTDTKKLSTDYCCQFNTNNQGVLPRSISQYMSHEVDTYYQNIILYLHEKKEARHIINYSYVLSTKNKALCMTLFVYLPIIIRASGARFFYFSHCADV